MSSSLPIQVSTRRMAPVTATAGQTAFPFTFPVIRAGDLRVLRTRAGVTVELALGTDYIVPLVGDPAGGTVTLLAGSAAGDVIVIEGDALLDRLTAITLVGRYSPALIDQELDLAVIRDQELRRDVDGMLTTAAFEEAVEDIVAGQIVGGTGISVGYDDAAGRITITNVGIPNGGSGNVVGPASSVDDTAAFFSGTSGRLLADKSITRAAVMQTIATVAAAAASTFPAGAATVQVLNYAAAADGGGALYARVNAQPSHLGRFRSQDRFLPNGTVDNALGGWWEIVGTDLNPLQFGAVADGTTDSAAAFSACCAATIAKGGGRVLLPAGTLRLKSTITLSVSNSLRFTIQGTGIYTSVLSFSDGATDGIVFTSSQTVANQHPTLELNSFSIETSRKNAGTAVSASWANNLNIQRPFTMDKVEIRQCITRISDSGADYGYWSRGLYLSNARNSYVSNSYIFGEMDRSPNTGNAIELAAECTFFTLHNVLILEAITGLYIGGTTEGVKMTSCSIVGVRYGVQHRIASGAEPELVITGCDFNAANVGVWAENVQMVKIQGCTFFACAWLDTGTWPTWTGVLLQGTLSRYTKIVGCSFTKESGRTGDVTQAIDANGTGGAILAVSACDFFGFAGNQMSFGVIVRSGFTRVDVDASCQFEYVASPFNNSGALSQRASKVIGGSAVVATGATITFPNAFAEAVQSVMAIHDGSNTAVNVTVGSITTSNFVLYHNGSGSVAIRWLAIGY